jgi:hypothetical protein
VTGGALSPFRWNDPLGRLRPDHDPHRTRVVIGEKQRAPDLDVRDVVGDDVAERLCRCREHHLKIRRG